VLRRYVNGAHFPLQIATDDSGTIRVRIRAPQALQFGR
jgi:hypothetical protein